AVPDVADDHDLGGRFEDRTPNGATPRGPGAPHGPEPFVGGVASREGAGTARAFDPGNEWKDEPAVGPFVARLESRQPPIATSRRAVPLPPDRTRRSLVHRRPSPSRDRRRSVLASTIPPHRSGADDPRTGGGSAPPSSSPTMCSCSTNAIWRSWRPSRRTHERPMRTWPSGWASRPRRFTTGYASSSKRG